MPFDLPTDATLPQPKKVKSLRDLLPAKMAVDTSLGRLFVRHMATSDLPGDEYTSDETRGKEFLRRLAGRVENKSDKTSLSESEVSALTEQDLSLIAPLMAKCSGGSDVPPGPALQAMGILAVQAAKRIAEIRRKQFESITRAVQAGYGFLPELGRDKLRDQLASINFASERLSEVVMSAPKQAGYPGLSEPDIVLRASYVPDFSNEPVFRTAAAAEETAVHLRATVDHISQLTSAMGDVHQSIVLEAIPTWMENLKEDRDAANDSLAQAQASLEVATDSLKVSRKAMQWSIGLAVFTVSVSIAVPYALGRWDRAQDNAEAARQQAEIDARLDARQAALERLLQQQVAAEVANGERQAVLSAELHSALKAMQAVRTGKRSAFAAP